MSSPVQQSPISPTPPSYLNQGVVLEMPVQATTDDQIIDMWLFGKSKSTQEAYSKDIFDFFGMVRKELKEIVLMDLQHYSVYLEQIGLSTRSQQRKLACIKSLLSFSTRLGYLRFDIGKVLKLPKSKDDLANRILDESNIIKIIYTETNLRNHLFLKTSYLLGARVSEIVNLTWDDLNLNGDNVVVTLFGKGSKTRNVLISNELYLELQQIKQDKSKYVFTSRKGGCLTREQAFRIVQKSALKAGIDKNISPHWFRHAHASHALAKGAPMPLIQRDLGHSSLAVTGRYMHAKPTDGSGLWLRV
jgi:integrase/recombinase XerD